MFNRTRKLVGTGFAVAGFGAVVAGGFAVSEPVPPAPSNGEKPVAQWDSVDLSGPLGSYIRNRLPEDKRRNGSVVLSIYNDPEYGRYSRFEIIGDQNHTLTGTLTCTNDESLNVSVDQLGFTAVGRKFFGNHILRHTDTNDIADKACTAHGVSSTGLSNLISS